MTTDELLAECRRLGEPTSGDGWRRLLWRAADEIERLRAENAMPVNLEPATIVLRDGESLPIYAFRPHPDDPRPTTLERRFHRCRYQVLVGGEGSLIEWRDVGPGEAVVWPEDDDA